MCSQTASSGAVITPGVVVVAILFHEIILPDEPRDVTLQCPELLLHALGPRTCQCPALADAVAEWLLCTYLPVRSEYTRLEHLGEIGVGPLDRMWAARCLASGGRQGRPRRTGVALSPALPHRKFRRLKWKAVR